MRSSLRTPDRYRIWGCGSFAHICLESPGCRFRRAGYCVMCDYGAGRMLTAEEATSALREALATWPVPVKRLLIGTCGSVFDDAEMPEDVRKRLLEAVMDTEIPTILFETHYSFVTEARLEELAAQLPGRTIAIELGFESANPWVLEHCLHKCMDLEELSQTIQRIRKHGVSPILNVFLGAPGLSTKQQLEDALSAIRWAYAHGASEVVVFPANLKPGTELWRKWRAGAYERISAWLLPELLLQLTDTELASTSISWYGDRQRKGIDPDVIAPAVCQDCDEILASCFQAFMQDFDPKRRRKMLSDVFQSASCACYSRLRQQIPGVSSHIAVERG